MYRRQQIPLLLIFVLLAGCTSRTKEVVKEQYVITDIICDRIDSTDKKPTKEELEGFVVGTRDTFDTLKKKGKSINISVYAKATTLSDRINNKEVIDIDELQQFVKMTRDTYKLLLEEKK
jgi:hypothetical protein